jgi:hypothetical protein
VNDQGVLATHEDLRGVLIHGALAITNIGDIPAAEAQHNFSHQPQNQNKVNILKKQS